MQRAEGQAGRGCSILSNGRGAYVAQAVVTVNIMEGVLFIALKISKKENMSLCICQNP